MNFSFQNNGKIVINVSNEEILELKRVVAQLSELLDDFIEIEREDLYYEVAPFLTNEAIRSKLSNLKFYIINDLEYNDTFIDVVYFKNGFVEFVSDDRLYHFANAYQILNDTSNALRVLKNILRVKLIDWLIENDFKEDNGKTFIYNIPLDLTTKGDHSVIFKGNSEELFYYIIRNTDEIDTRKNFGAFYSWFSKYLKECSQYDFACFWNSLDLPFKVKVYKESRSASFSNLATDEMNLLLNNLKDSFHQLDKIKRK